MSHSIGGEYLKESKQPRVPINKDSDVKTNLRTTEHGHWDLTFWREAQSDSTPLTWVHSETAREGSNTHEQRWLLD